MRSDLFNAEFQLFTDQVPPRYSHICDTLSATSSVLIEDQSQKRMPMPSPLAHTRCEWRHHVSVSCACSVNVGCGPAEERVLLTGLHAVADIFCECCKTTLGWKYVSRLSSRAIITCSCIVQLVFIWQRLRNLTDCEYWLVELFCWGFLCVDHVLHTRTGILLLQKRDCG